MYYFAALMDTHYLTLSFCIWYITSVLEFTVFYLAFFFQTSFFQQFMEAHPECSIRQRAFERLKPWWVKKLKEWNTCCCIYHVEMDPMKAGLSTLRDKLRGFHTSTNCACNSVVCSDSEGGARCHAHDRIYKHITSMWELVFVLKESMIGGTG